MNASGIAKPASQPLVSVGIPTYNRPEGLRRTIECITRQTYRNLEIIVSDNGSPDDKTERIVREFMAGDPRIQFYRQQDNLGIIFNFKYVLEKATGDFFLWAADDDEWDSSFVDFCLNNIGDSGSIMTDYKVKYRKSGKIVGQSLPILEGIKGSARDMTSFLKAPQPTMFYGLHRRAGILWFLDANVYDWYDCYFCLRIIFNHGFKTVNGPCLFSTVIETDNYVPKPLNSRFTNPFPYFFKSLRYVLTGNSLHNFLIHLHMLYTIIAVFTFRRSDLHKQ